MKNKIVIQPPIPESEIVQLLLLKDKRGLECLYDTYAYSVYAIIERYVTGLVAEEVLYKCFLYYWNHIGTFDPSTKGLFTWMACIARKFAKERLEEDKMSFL